MAFLVEKFRNFLLSSAGFFLINVPSKHDFHLAIKYT